MPTWVTSLLIFLAAMAALAYNIWRDQRHGRVELTVRLYDKWSNKEYSQSRANAHTCFVRAWAHALKDQPLSSKTTKIKVPITEIYRQGGSDNDFGMIEHFFDDLGALAHMKQLDKRLSLVLFKDITDHWRTVLEQVSWDGVDQSAWWDEKLKINLDNLYAFWKLPYKSRTDELQAKLANLRHDS